MGGRGDASRNPVASLQAVQGVQILFLSKKETLYRRSEHRTGIV